MPVDNTEAVDPSSGSDAGLLLTAAQELADLRVRHLDVAPDTPVSQLTRWVQEELACIGSPEPEVARRAQRRLVPRLAPVVFQETSKGLPFLRDDALLLCGGFGGVGRVLIEDLQARGFGPLLIVGQRRQEDLDDEAQAILSESPRVYYRSVDARDPLFLRQAVVELEQAADATSMAAFQLAGAMPSAMLRDETEAALESVIALKRSASEVLSALMADRGGCFVDFSSVNGVFGGFAVGAYSAANRLALAQAACARQRGERVWSFAWSRWRDIGLTRDQPGSESAAERGYQAIGPADGVRSMWACLHQPPGEFIVGLDESKLPIVQRLVNREPRVYQLSQVQPAGKSNAKEAVPLTPTGKAVASVWADALGATDLDANDNFFDRGGHSLLLVQVQGLLEERLAREVSLMDLFRHPTVKGLAAFLDGCEQGDARLANAKARGEAQRKRSRARAAARGRRHGIS